MWARTRIIRITIALACLLGAWIALFGHSPAPMFAQDEPPQGICDGTVCGPSGGFSPESFPTRAAIDWSGFPRPVARDALAPAPGGRTIYVAAGASGDGSPDAPFGSLNAALDAAAPGDLIWVADGVYTVGTDDSNEGLSIDTPDLILMAERPGAVILTPRDPDQHIVGVAARANNLIIDGFVIQGFAEVGLEYGNIMAPQTTLRLQHLIVEQSEEGIRSAYGGSGTQPLVESMLIYDVWLRNISLIALQCGEGPCNNLRWEALRIAMEGGEMSYGSDAIAVESGDNIVVFNVEVTGVPGDGIDLKTSSGVIANAFVHHIKGTAFKLWFGGDIINALSIYSGDYAAISTDAGEFRIVNTLIARHAWGNSAYAMSSAYDNPHTPGQMEIVNSAFFQNSGALWISPSLELSVLHSLLTASANGEELVWGDLVIGVDNESISALEAAGAGVNNLSQIEPMFSDPDGDDYRLLPGSPLIDAGTDTIPLPPFDLFGNPRVSGASVDIGPIEWTPPAQ